MLNERELKARYEVALEQYNKTAQHRSAADGADGEPLHPAGRLPVPGRAGAERGGGQGGGRDREGSARRRSTTLVRLTDEFKAEGRQAAGAARARGRRRRREAREVLPRQGHPGDGRAARDGRQPRERSCRRTSGRCRPTARCCSSSRPVTRGLRPSDSSRPGARVIRAPFFVRVLLSCRHRSPVSQKGAGMVIRKVGIGSVVKVVGRAVRVVGLVFGVCFALFAASSARRGVGGERRHAGVDRIDVRRSARSSSCRSCTASWARSAAR